MKLLNKKMLAFEFIPTTDSQILAIDKMLKD
jgi:hypothetical protein